MKNISISYKGEILYKLTQILFKSGYGEGFKLQWADNIYGWYTTISRVNKKLAEPFWQAILNGLGQEVLK